MQQQELLADYSETHRISTLALSRLVADVEDELRGEGEDVLDWTPLETHYSPQLTPSQQAAANG